MFFFFKFLNYLLYPLKLWKNSKTQSNYFIAICITQLFLNKENKLTNYFRKASFPIYILHQTFLVIIRYYTLIIVDSIV